MEIAADTVVSFDYTLTNDAGDVLDSSSGQGPMAYLHGHSQIISGLEQAMAGRQSGDEFSVTVAPAEGYGEHIAELVQAVPRSAFEGIESVEPGMRFQAQGPNGPMVVKVVEVADETITIDGNHELAGTTLHFAVQIKEVREATPQELDHGHVHAGGHDH